MSRASGSQVRPERATIAETSTEGGRLILDQKVRSVMKMDVRTVDVSASMFEARQLLDAHPFHHLPVVASGKLVGILSSIDLARVSFERWVEDRASRDAWLAQWSVREVMTPVPDALYPDDPIRLAAERLGDGVYHALPVIDNEHKVVGIVTTTDLVRLLYSELRG